MVLYQNTMSITNNTEYMHNIEAEKALLGALILDNNLVENIPDYFLPYHFAAEIHSKIFEIIRQMTNEGLVADPITMSIRLKNDKLFKKNESEKYITDLVDSVISLSSIATYAQIIYDLYLRRQLIIIGEETSEEARNTEEYAKAMLVLESTEKKLYDLAEESTEKGRLFSFGVALSESIKAAKAAYERDYVGISTGFRDLDKWLGGLHKSDLLIIAGRPSMGKTALATNIAFNVAKLKLQKSKAGTAVAFFSLEMSAEQLCTRILASESDIASDNIRKGEIPRNSFENFSRIYGELNNLELFIDDTPNISVAQLRNRVRRLKRKQEIGLVVVDYLQLIDPGRIKRNFDNRVNEVSEITRGLKGLAKEMNIPVIALSQLSRAVEQRNKEDEDKRPQLSDLRDSGSIEQDADVVMFVFREEYYKARKEPPEKTERYDKWRLEMEAVRNKAEIIIAKQRHGPIGTIKLYFDGRLTRFGNLMT
jgi:replicative DNA helicase